MFGRVTIRLGIGPHSSSPCSLAEAAAPLGFKILRNKTKVWNLVWQPSMTSPGLHCRIYGVHSSISVVNTYPTVNVFGRPFVKRFTLCYRTAVLSVLSVTLGYCGQTALCIRIPLGTEVGLSPGHIVLDGDPAPPPKGHSSLQFSAHVYCGQTAG